MQYSVCNHLETKIPKTGPTGWTGHRATTPNNRGHPRDMTNECLKFQVDRIIRSEVIIRKPPGGRKKKKEKEKEKEKKNPYKTIKAFLPKCLNTIA